MPGFELMTLEHKSPPITTRPGLPPTLFTFYPIAGFEPYGGTTVLSD